MKIMVSILALASLLLITSSLTSATISEKSRRSTRSLVDLQDPTTLRSDERLVLEDVFGSGAVAPAPESKDGPALVKWCGQKCEGRCKEAGMKDRCLKYCGICCKDCQCVPSGTYGNKHECACYRDKLSNKGTPKCP